MPIYRHTANQSSVVLTYFLCVYACVVVRMPLCSRVCASVEGILKGFDQLVNLVLDESKEFIKGEAAAHPCAHQHLMHTYTYVYRYITCMHTHSRAHGSGMRVQCLTRVSSPGAPHPIHTRRPSGSIQMDRGDTGLGADDM
jgi:small nuclear ribonucleoprotein (snRNP)-like protein